MNISKRQRRLAAKKAIENGPEEFHAVDLTKSAYVPPGMTRSYRNRYYTVMIYDDHPTSHGPAIRVMVQHHRDEPIKFHWREMMNIKNKLFGAEMTAIEYYPPMSELIDDKNIYWMWLFPKGVLPVPFL